MPKDLQKGFTLIELLVVVAIIGILAAMALPKMGNIVAERELDGAAKMLSADIRLLQQMSINTNDFDGAFATPVMNFNKSTVPCTYNISQSAKIIKQNNLPDSVRVSTTFNTITFSINGIPVQGYTVTLGSTVISGKYKYVIVAAATGRVRISDTYDVQ